MCAQGTDEALGKLREVGHSTYRSVDACLLGTRTSVINAACEWAEDASIVGRFLWIYGTPGLGKSAVAASICSWLETKCLLGASFFCRWDDLELQDPRLVLRALVHALATRCEEYEKLVVSILHTTPSMCTWSQRQLYEVLIRVPLITLSSSDTVHKPICILVDGLNERETNMGHIGLLAYLHSISQLVPWIKVIAVGQSDKYVEKFFDNTPRDSVKKINLAEYDASLDIHQYTSRRMASISNGSSQATNSVAPLLVERAGGMFVWADFACRFIFNGVDPHKRLAQVLRIPVANDSPSRLDLLYAIQLEHAVINLGDSNLDVAERWFGAIISTSFYAPLSASALAKLLSLPLDIAVLDKLADCLSPAVYIDTSQDFQVPIRVYDRSFVEYSTHQLHPKHFRVDLAVQNALLSARCLRTLLTELFFNVCGLETSYMLNRDLINLESRVATAIQPHLRYACLYWIDHTIALSSANFDLGPLAEFFIGRALFYWIEALSLLGKLDVAVSMLPALITWASGEKHLVEILEAAQETYGFVMRFYDLISTSTPHLYISALAFAPDHYKLVKRGRGWFPNTLRVAEGATQHLSHSLNSMAHLDSVSCLSLSPDNNTIVTGSVDGNLYLWDAQTGVCTPHPIIGHTDCVWAVAFSPCGQIIASGSNDKSVRFWDAYTGRDLHRPLAGHSGPILSVAFSGGGKHFVSGSHDRTVRVWDVGAGFGMCVELYAHSGPVLCVTFSPDGSRVASGSADKTLRIWNIKSKSHVQFKGHTGWVQSVAFSPDGRQLASGSFDRTIRIWDPETGASITGPMVGHSGPVNCVAFSPTGQQIASSSSDCTVRLWSTETGKETIKPYMGHSGAVFSIAFLASGYHIISCSSDHTVQTWEIGINIPEPTPLVGHSHRVTSVAFSPDGGHIISGSADKTVRVWDAETGVSVSAALIGHTSSVMSVGVSPDGQRYVSGSNDGTIRLWDAQTNVIACAPLVGHYSTVGSVVISPDGSRIVSGSWDETVRIWDARNGASVGAPLVGHSSSVLSVAVSSDGRYIASGSGDRQIRIWHAETGTPTSAPLTGHSGCVVCVTFSPDGQQIASGSDDETVRIWSVKTGTPALSPLVGHNDCVNTVAFSPDGQLIASGSDDTRIRLWNATTGSPISRPLVGHSGQVTSVAFSPDGQRIVSGSRDKTIRIWVVSDIDGDTSSLLPIGVSALLSFVQPSGWVSRVHQPCLFWLPSEYRNLDADSKSDDSLICIRNDSTHSRITIDYGKFVHGNAWTRVAAGSG